MSTAELVPRPTIEREVQQKFRVHGLFRLPDLVSIDGVGAVVELGTAEFESAYFDTADVRLAREGITLRRRVGEDEGWHLKLPAGSGEPEARDEIRLPLEAASDSPPDTLLDIVRIIVRTSPVRLVSTLRTRRVARRINDDAGTALARLVDDTVYVVDHEGTATARFRELELEERGGREPLAAVWAALLSAGAVRGEFVAKVVRALGPAAARPPEVPVRPAPGPDTAAAATVIAYLSTQVRALRAADMEFRRHPESAGEAVHQMRVAARRLRGGLRTFQSLLAPAWAKQLAGELRWFAHGLNDLRESEVLRSRLCAHTAALPDDVPAEPIGAFLTTTLDAQAARARAAALRVLRSERYLALHEALVGAVNDPALTGEADHPARDVLPPLVDDAWNRLVKAAEALAPDSPTANWHDARLRAKRARYAAEAVAMSLGDDAKTFARQMERLTDLLGEHQDAVQAAELLHRLARREDADPEIIFALGALATTEHEYARTARRRFGTIWRDARRAKWRRWMDVPEPGPLKTA